MSLNHFWKYHAQGNSYIVLDKSEPPSPPEIVQLCSAQTGIGSDGILIGRRLGEHEFAVQIFNPDGTQAEKSGNGLRIFARSVWDRRLTDQPELHLTTVGGPTTAWSPNLDDYVTIELGPVDVFPDDPKKIPGRFERLAIEGQILNITPVSTGNPHCVIFQSDDSRVECRRLGPLIETHSRFPNRTNVQFARIQNRNEIWLEIWERGAGYTLSSGSSACATAGAALFHGFTNSRIRVRCPGGTLFVEIDKNWSAKLSGHVQKIAQGTFNNLTPL